MLAVLLAEGGGVAGKAMKRINYATAAAHLGLKVQTLRTMVHRKQVPHIRLGPKLVVFDVETLDAWLRERSVPANDGTR